jgi:hypothetical protein
MKRWLRATAILGMALAGLVGGHLLGYLAAEPDAHAREALLERTGHLYLAEVGMFAAIAVAVATLAAAVLGAARRRSRGVRGTFARLATLQGVAFVALEMGERLLAGEGLTGLWPVIPLGLLLQVVLAAGGAAFLGAVQVAARAVASAIGRHSLPTAERPRSLGVPHHVLPPTRHDLRPRPIRGPPPLLASR